MISFVGVLILCWICFTFWGKKKLWAWSRWQLIFFVMSAFHSRSYTQQWRSCKSFSNLLHQPWIRHDCIWKRGNKEHHPILCLHETITMDSMDAGKRRSNSWNYVKLHELRRWPSISVTVATSPHLILKLLLRKTEQDYGRTDTRLLTLPKCFYYMYKLPPNINFFHSAKRLYNYLLTSHSVPPCLQHLHRHRIDVSAY